MRKKVFVSGCYDMLHSGHVAFFNEAASYGDLYVGLGSDHTIFELKARKPINPEAERLYMVKSLRCVHDAWINSGSGIMDFEKEVRELKPDIFFVNSDGFSPLKEKFCRELGIKLVVSERIPHIGLPARSTTALRSECRIPYRVELCGGWMDQPFVNELVPGSVITVSIEPDIEFNDKSGMATSSRKKAIEMWQTQIPAGDREQLAKQLFCMDNPPGTKVISGSQDALGLIMPGLNKLSYDNSYWPYAIETRTDDEMLDFIESGFNLVALPQRENGYNVFAETNINRDDAKRLADATEDCWQAMLAHDIVAWGDATKRCFEAQLAMFPKMATPALMDAIEYYRNQACGWKLSGAGGGGYLILVGEKNIDKAIRVRACRE